MLSLNTIATYCLLLKHCNIFFVAKTSQHIFCC